MIGYFVNLTFVADPDDEYGTDEEQLYLCSETDYSQDDMQDMFEHARAICNGYNEDEDDCDYDNSLFYNEGCNSNTLLNKFYELYPNIKDGNLPMTVHHVYDIFISDC